MRKPGPQGKRRGRGQVLGTSRLNSEVRRDVHLDCNKVTIVSAVLLGAIASILASWRRRPSADNADLLEAGYMATVSNAYA